MGYSSGKDSDYSYGGSCSSTGKDSDRSSSSKDSDNYSSIHYFGTTSGNSSRNEYTPTRPSSKLALQLIKSMEEKQELEEKRIRNEAEIAKVDKKIQELILKLKDDPNFSDIVDRFNVLVLK